MVLGHGSCIPFLFMWLWFSQCANVASTVSQKELFKNCDDSTFLDELLDCWCAGDTASTARDAGFIMKLNYINVKFFYAQYLGATMGCLMC